MMVGVNYVIYGCYSARITPGVSLYRNVTLEGNIVAVIQDRVILAFTQLPIFYGKQLFSWLGRFIYKHFFIYYSW